MILTGPQIAQEILKGRIKITPFREKSIQPNCYDFHLGDMLYRYSYGTLNHETIQYQTIKLNEDGVILQPGDLYLGITEEVISTDHFSQLLFGDESVGALGIWVQVSAPLAHIGSHIRWTLEIRVLKRTIVFPGMKFGKICFLMNSGSVIPYGSNFWNSGKYVTNALTPSLLDQDILP